MKSVLIFRPGTLGDTLVALPALWAVRKHFYDHSVVLLSDCHPRRGLVPASEVLKGSGVCDEFLEYPVDLSWRGRVALPWRMGVLLARLRRRRFGALVYLASAPRSRRQVARDHLFFRSAGIGRFIGMDLQNGLPPVPGPLAPAPESDLLLQRLEFAGIEVPAFGEGSTELGLGPVEEARVGAWLAKLPSDGGRQWISVGPGGKKPVNLWPIERYEAVVASLIQRFDVWPVVFGGAADRETIERLIANWGRGHNAAGALNVRAAMAAMKRCLMHLGNDTGTMHMAASVRIPCVGIFASAQPLGWWHPYGAGHRILQRRIDCEGCLLEKCEGHAHECLLSTTTDHAMGACVEILTRPDRLTPCRAVEAT